MTNTAHTPTPWRTFAEPYGTWIIKNANDTHLATIAACSPEMNANVAADCKHIVACVNAHDALVARVAELEAALRDFVDAAERGATTFFDLRGSCLRKARAALAKGEA